jgi:glucosamine--fructose-6-phosphate aminotransferase (isomerizing)
MRFIDAIRAQGKGLRTSGAAVSGRLDAMDLAPWRGRRLALTGMGASSNAIAAALPGYWAAGVRAVGWGASELLLTAQAGVVGYPAQAGVAGHAGQAGVASTAAEAVIAVSQTGKSAEVHAALRALPDGTPRLVLTDVPDSPIGALADEVLALALIGDSEVRTVGYTSTVQALLLLRDAIAGRVSPGWDQIADETERLTADAERLADQLPEGLREATTFDVVGSGVHAGTADQGALLLREVAKLPASGYETYQYLHGPVEAAGAGRALIVIGGAREVKLARSLADVGAHVLLVTDQDVSSANLTVFRLPEAGDKAGLLAVLPLQAMAWRIAEDRDVPDGVFRYHQDDTKVAG